MDEKAVSILEDLVRIAWIEVGFLIDSSGRLLASVGKSDAFSPTGEFRNAVPEIAHDANTNLYITGLNANVYLGVLFPADVPIEDVRAEVEKHSKKLTKLMPE